MNASEISARVRSFLAVHRRVAGPVIGALAGSVGGVPGTFAGLVMGYLIQEIIGQWNADRAVRRYFEDPGLPDFSEGEPGLAAFCALGVIISSPSSGAEVPYLVRTAFPRGREETAYAENFCRIAASGRARLNPDLLAESLAARRALFGDLPRLADALYSLAANDAARSAALDICLILDPAFSPEGKKTAAETAAAEAAPDECWRILGLEKGAGADEVKAAYHRLALQFHPDSLVVLPEEQQRAAGQAFIKIEDAYRRISADRRVSADRRISADRGITEDINKKEKK